MTRAIRYKGIYRFNMSAFKTMNPFEFSLYNHTLGRVQRGSSFYCIKSARQTVSVNLSSQDLFDPALKRTLGEAIRENELSYGDLKLEIRESVCAENKFQIFDIVENLRRAG